MTTLKLEVGKTYINRNGGKVTIDRIYGTGYYPAWSAGSSYTLEGRYYKGEHFSDLISEYVETVDTPQASTRTPHKWAKEMHAFADGYEIEFLNVAGAWRFIAAPDWHHESTYRIKPEPAPLKPNDVGFIRLWDGQIGDYVYRSSTCLLHKGIRIEYDPNTGTLVSAEVVTL